MVVNKIENISVLENTQPAKPVKDYQAETVQNPFASGTKFRGEANPVYQGEVKPSENLWLAECINCEKYTNWLGKNSSANIYEPESLKFMFNRQADKYINGQHVLPERIRELLLDAAEIYAKSPQEAEEYLRQAVRRIVKYINQDSSISDDIEKMIDSVYTKQDAEEALALAKSAIEKLSGSYYLDNTEAINKLLNIFNFLTGIIAAQQKELVEKNKANLNI